jgi:hypothetical protein
LELTMKPGTPKIDATTPAWPVVLVRLGEPPSVFVNGATTPLTSADPQAEAVARAARQARSLRRPVRMTVTTSAGDEQQLIVTEDGVVVPLDTPGRASAKVSPKAKPAVSRRALDRFPRPVRWAGLALGVLTALSLVVIVTHGRPDTAQAPAPPAGQLYTELPPPGWSQHAAWVVPIADDTVPATDPATGVTAAVTPQDRSTSDTAAQRVGPKDRWLSVLEPDGRTRFAVALDRTPTFGPVITRVDGAAVALIATARQIQYWQLDSGAGTTVDLPTGAKLSAGGESVLITMPGDRAGYLHDGGLQTVRVLPRTSPVIALDGAVVVVQPDTGAWWTLRADAAPTVITPVTPTSAGIVNRVLAVSADRVIVVWNMAAPNPRTPSVVIAAFHRDTGEQDGSTTTPTSTFGRPASAFSSNGTVAAGSVILTPTSLTVAAGFTATSVADRAYGTVQGQPAIVDALGHPVVLPDGTLIPTGASGGHLMVVSQSRLYALNPEA